MSLAGEVLSSKALVVLEGSHESAAMFHRSIVAAKELNTATEKSSGVFKTIDSKCFGSFVHAYDEISYSSMTLLLSSTTIDEGTAAFGLAIKSDTQEIVSVFKNTAQKTKESALDVLLPEAVSLGGRYLDCFDGMLPCLYAKYGFVPVAKLPFDPDYAPEDWNYARDKTPDIIFMAHCPAATVDLTDYSSFVVKIRSIIARVPQVSCYEDGYRLQTAFSAT